LDLSTYAGAEHDGRQCPGCGSFATTASEDAAQQVNTCRTCGRTWRSGAGLPDPDVVVRSWLHR
jgi:ribosomal protein L37AE/L43A